MKNATRLVLLILTIVPTTAVAAQNVDAGLYATNCAGCHGADLRGGTGSDLLDGVWAFGENQIVNVIKNGIPERGMPAFGEMLGDDQIQSIVAFIEQAERDPSIVTPAVPDSLVALDYELKAEVFAHGLSTPWAIEFLDGSTALITELSGALRVVENGRLLPDSVRGTPEVIYEGQGGFLDVTADPNFAENGWIYLSYSHLLPNGQAMTRIVRGRLRDNRWVDQEVIFEAPHDTYMETRHHYGSRIVFDPEGYLYFSVGDRGRGNMSQDLSRPNGKVHRIYADGSIPEDNPFLHMEGALPSIYSYGHRNPQGMAVDPETGRVWAAEHGPRGGDELNLVAAGRNYGWQVITYGINYNGSVMTEFRQRAGMEEPVAYWRPSIAVSGLDFYDGDLFADWQGRLLVGALRDKEVRLVHIEEGRVLHQEVILKDAGRVREAKTGPDGAIYVVLNEPDMVLRLTPSARHWR